jgi:hypothetical protein
MKIATSLLLLLGLTVGQGPHAEEPNIQRPHWVIIETIIDRRTGEPVKEVKLGGPELEFDNSLKCKSIIDNVHLTPSNYTIATLTCRRVVPARRVVGADSGAGAHFNFLGSGSGAPRIDSHT